MVRAKRLYTHCSPSSPLSLWLSHFPFIHPHRSDVSACVMIPPSQRFFKSVSFIIAFQKHWDYFLLKKQALKTVFFFSTFPSRFVGTEVHNKEYSKAFIKKNNDTYTHLYPKDRYKHTNISALQY